MADVDQIVTGRRREGSFAGVMTFIRKATQAAAVMFVGIILEAGGFVSNSDVQSADAVTTIVATLVIGPVVVLLLGFWVSTKFRLSSQTHSVLMAEIERFKQGERTPSSAESQSVVEDLAGCSYDKMWGNNSIGRT